MEQKNKNIWFEQCVEKNQTPLTRYTHKIVKVYEASQDVVQDSFLKLWDQVFPKNAEFYPVAWLFRTSRNGAIDYLRKAKRYESLEERPDLDIAVCLDDELLDRSKILQLVQELKGIQREVLILRFQEELSYREMAEITGKSVTHIGNLIHEAIKELRSLLTKKGVEL